MGLRDRLCHSGELLARLLRVRFQQGEGGVGVDAVSLHEDAFGLLDDGAASERSLQVLELGEPPQRDVESALDLGGVIVVQDDVAKTPRLAASSTYPLSATSRSAMTGQAASRTISEICSSACAPSRPKRTSATSAPVLRLSAPIAPMSLSRPTISWPKLSTIAVMLSSLSSRSLAISTCRRCSVSGMALTVGSRFYEARYTLRSAGDSTPADGGLTKRTPSI